MMQKWKRCHNFCKHYKRISKQASNRTMNFMNEKQLRAYKQWLLSIQQTKQKGLADFKIENFKTFKDKNENVYISYKVTTNGMFGQSITMKYVKIDEYGVLTTLNDTNSPAHLEKMFAQFEPIKIE